MHESFPSPRAASERRLLPFAGLGSVLRRTGDFARRHLHSAAASGIVVPTAGPCTSRHEHFAAAACVRALVALAFSHCHDISSRERCVGIRAREMPNENDNRTASHARSSSLSGHHGLRRTRWKATEYSPCKKRPPRVTPTNPPIESPRSSGSSVRS